MLGARLHQSRYVSDNTIVPTQTETTCSHGLAIFKAISFVDNLLQTEPLHTLLPDGI